MRPFLPGESARPFLFSGGCAGAVVGLAFTTAGELLGYMRAHPLRL